MKELGDKITVQTGDWNCVNIITPNHKPQMATVRHRVFEAHVFVPSAFAKQAREAPALDPAELPPWTPDLNIARAIRGDKIGTLVTADEES